MKSEFDEDRGLWELLGRAETPRVPQRFHADVMRAIRSEHDPASGWNWQLLLRWMMPAGATALAAVCLFLANPSSTTSPLMAAQSTENLTFREAADFDGLVADSAGWAWHEVAP